MTRLLRTLLLPLLLWLALPAQADELRPGYLELTQASAAEWKLVWKAPILGGLATRASPQLPPFCAVSMAPPRLVGGALVATGSAHCSQALDGASVGLAGLAAPAERRLVAVWRRQHGHRARKPQDENRRGQNL